MAVSGSKIRRRRRSASWTSQRPTRPAAARPRAAPGPLEDSDVFSDVVLSYISRMLMEEDVDEKVNALYQESPAIRAAEKPFYDILGEKYPHDPYPSSTTTTTTESTDDRSNGGGGSNSSNRWLYSSQSSVSPSNSAGSVVESPESQQAWHFRKGMEEARKFLPSYDKLVVDSEANGFSFSRGRRKNPSIEELELAHGRSNKQSAVSAPSEETIRSDMFDKVLLCNGDKCKTVSALREAMQNGGNRGASGAKVPGGGGGKTRGGKKQTKKEVWI
ncbi:scarecrow-like protein 9 [Iris pallida]|uniref:Scarecrow-like protein 9 n=1 Tax=Iris pallida TaxID=29817 RepID=A0AAX6E509_IRIPA|nr:scarecrow-like protein 9 [Iris pallida]